MRIGIDIRPLMDREYSGVSWYTLDLLTAIFRQDKINEYFLYYNSGRDISARMPEFKEGNVKVVATKYPNKLFNYFLQNILKWPKLDKISSPPFRGGLPADGRRGSGSSPLQGEVRRGLDIFWMPHINFASFSKDCRKILTIHDLSFLVFPEFFSNRKNFWHKMLNVKKQLTVADKIIAISENTKNDVIKFYGVPEEKISVIYSGVGPEFKPFRRSPEAETAAGQSTIYSGAGSDSPLRHSLRLGTVINQEREETPLRHSLRLGTMINQEREETPLRHSLRLGTVINQEREETPLRHSLRLGTVTNQESEKLEEIKVKYNLPGKFILNIGTIEPRKNIIGLVRAFDLAVQDLKLKDYYLVIVGGGGWKNKEIYKAINLAKNKDKIKVIGYIEKSERVYFYNLATIFCYPSFYEGFGLPVLEAMASGVPVITSAVSSLPEVAGSAALYVDPNDIATISMAMLQLAISDELRDSMIEKGLVQARKFSWEKTAKEYLKIFSN